MDETSKPRRLLDDDGAPVALALFCFGGCYFCDLVRRVIDELELQVRYRDILADEAAAAELLRIGGKRQVPCLLIGDRPLYESRDIIAFLRGARIEAGDGSYRAQAPSKRSL